MADEQNATIEDLGSNDGASRQRSTIGFPYADLKASIELAEAIHGNVGTGECDDDQLAAWTEQSPKSSGFRTQVYAARMFGLLSGEGTGKHRLTELGRMIVDPNRAREAKVRAFMSVPLYAAVYENYKGGVIPPAAALERDMVGMGVAEKQKDRARQVFERSAEQAGYFEHGKNRLVAPGVQQGAQQENKRDEIGGGGGGGGGDGDGGGGHGELDVVISALIKKLPKGATFDASARVRWLRQIEMAFVDAYGEVNDGSIEIKLKKDGGAD